MYTLLGASVLGFDLVRRPGGDAVADLLVDALALGPQHLPVLGRARGQAVLGAGPARSVARAEVSPLSSALGRMGQLVAAGRVTEALALIESAPMAGLDELLHCVRGEALGWVTDPGADVEPAEVEAALSLVCDAVVAAYHRASLSPSLHAQLSEGWERARARISIDPVPLGPCQVEVDALLGRLATLDEAGRERLAETAARLRAVGGWAPAMHSATWAVHLTDRVRAAAGAQLRAVSVLTATGLSTTDAASGIWNLVSGAVQAAMVNDLLDDETHERLLSPVVDALERRP